MKVIDCGVAGWDSFANPHSHEGKPAMRASQLLLGIVCASVLLPNCVAQSSKKPKTGDKAGDKTADKMPDKAGPATLAATELATVDDQKITEDDLAPYVAGQLRPLREQEYQIKKKALDSLINQKIVEAEAKKKGLTTEKLYEQEVDSKVAEPTDVEIAAVYAVQREQLNRPFEEVKAQLTQTLKNAKIQQARKEYAAHLREQAKVGVLLSPPRVQVGIDPTRVRGNLKAKVMIVEFSDFQCPFCGQVQGTLKNVLAKHDGTVALAFRDLPVSQIHPQAMSAAQAARCAGEQGKFWEYHDLLFADQAGLDKPGLVTKAKKLQLDEKQFDSCISGEKYKAQIQQDSQEGMRAGVSGTPGFFVNGVFLSGAQPEATFDKLIEEQLSARP
jgi:protein-disulfide isomerase